MHALEGTISALEQSPDIPSIDCLIHVLQECRKAQATTCSRRVHLLINEHGLEAQTALGNHIVPVLVECGCFHAARQAFSKLFHHNEHSWTSLIQGFSEYELGSREPLGLLQDMQKESAEATSYTYLALLKICMQESTWEDCQQIYEEIVKEGLEEDPYIASALVTLYAKFGTLSEAQDIFDHIAVRDIVLWTLMIMEYVQHDRFGEALLCSEAVEKDGVSMDGTLFVSILQACGTVGDLDKGREMHAMIVKKGFEQDLFVGNSLVDMYSKCDCLKEALWVFNVLPMRDVVSWNSLLGAYSELGTAEDVVMCLERMRIEGVLPSNITLVCAFKALGTMKEKSLLQTMHSEIVKEGIELDLFVGNGLLDAYSKCGLVTEAQNVFDNLFITDLISWTSLLGGYSEEGLFEEAFGCLQQMHVEGIAVDAVALVCMLKLCGSSNALESGLELHILAIVDGFENDLAVANSLIDFYANCSKMVEAQDTFDDLSMQSVVSWNTLLGGYAEQGLGDETLDCLESMRSKNVPSNLVTYVCALQGCGSIGALHIGQSLHMELTKKGYDRDLLVGNTLLDLNSKCGSFAEAHSVFDELDEKDVVSWVALLSGYVENDCCLEALECFRQMKADEVSLNSLAYINILKACGKLRALDEAQVVYLDITLDGLDTDEFLVTALVNLYAKCGLPLEAHELLDTLHSRDTASWNALLTGLVDYGLSVAVLESHAQMLQEGVFMDSVTFVCCLKACGQTNSLSHGLLLHLEVVRDGLELGTSVCHALIEMYSKFGLVEEFEDVFEEILTKTVVTWNVLLNGYDFLELAEKVLRCFEDMQHLGYSANAWMYACCLRACMKTVSMEKGWQMHVALIADGHEEEISVLCPLIDMYASWGFFHEALDILHDRPVKDTVLWNAVLLGYMKHGCSEGALGMLEEMRSENVSPDAVTYMCCLKACINIGAINKGKELHAMISKEEFEHESIVGNTLVDMYAKCGLLLEAQEVFDDLLVQDVVSWSALLAGHACRGDFRQVCDLFEKMIKQGLQPDEILLLRLLSACSHEGLVEFGQLYIENTCTEFDTAITVEHVNCMMDCLSRAGQLDELVAMAERIPCMPDAVTWTTVLGACRKWGNVGLGEQAFDGAKSLDDNEAGSFILLSNIYAGD